MNQKILEIYNLKKGPRSYIDCLYALLTSAGLFYLPKYMLSGMTGMAFKFVIHKRLLPSSLDLYYWQEENWQAVNSLGIYNETYSDTPMNATFPLYQKNMLHKIISSIDDGKAVIGWEIERPIFCLTSKSSIHLALVKNSEPRIPTILRPEAVDILSLAKDQSFINENSSVNLSEFT